MRNTVIENGKMEKIISKLKELSSRSNQIVLYNPNVVNVMKGIGRVIGKFDSQLLEFLKYTNGASVFDYCFMGFKNPRLGVDIDKFSKELWMCNNRLAGQFIPFMSTSSGDNFGYLVDVFNKGGDHPIVYYSDSADDSLYFVGSCFSKFMNTFLEDVEYTLSKHHGKFMLGIDIEYWPVVKDHWIKNDDELRALLDNGIMYEKTKKLMPDTKLSGG